MRKDKAWPELQKLIEELDERHSYKEAVAFGSLEQMGAPDHFSHTMVNTEEIVEFRWSDLEFTVNVTHNFCFIGIRGTDLEFLPEESFTGLEWETPLCMALDLINHYTKKE